MDIKWYKYTDGLSRVPGSGNGYYKSIGDYNSDKRYEANVWVPDWPHFSGGHISISQSMYRLEEPYINYIDIIEKGSGYLCIVSIGYDYQEKKSDYVNQIYEHIITLKLDESMEFYYPGATGEEKQALMDYHDLIKNAYDVLEEVWGIN